MRQERDREVTPEQVIATLLISLFGVLTAAIIGIQGLKQTLQQMGIVAVIIALSFAIAKIFF